MKKLKVDLKELASEMDLGENLELSGYLDTDTGEIISMPDNVMHAVEESDEAIEDLSDWEQELVETAENILSDEKNRFLLIPRRESREGYEIMVAFTESVRRKGLREKLSFTLNGRGAFRRFRSVLNDYPDELEKTEEQSVTKRLLSSTSFDCFPLIFKVKSSSEYRILLRCEWRNEYHGKGNYFYC